MKKTFDSAFRKAANSRRTRLAVLATTMVVLGIALSTGAAALATDTRDIQSTTDHSTTDTRTTTDTTTSSTSTSSTSTISTSTSTVSVAGVTGAGGEAAGGGGAPGGGQGGGGAPAAQAAAGEGQLPFTGVHVPALIVIALGMIAGGIALRRKLEDAA